MKNLIEERARLKSEFDGLKQSLDKEKTKALRNEDELIEEIDALEKKLNEHLLRQDAQREEILELQEAVQPEDEEHEAEHEVARTIDTLRYHARVAVTARREILEGADAHEAARDAGNDAAGQQLFAGNLFARGDGGQRPCGRDAERVHGQRDFALPSRSQPSEQKEPDWNRQ